MKACSPLLIERSSLLISLLADLLEFNPLLNPTRVTDRSCVSLLLVQLLHHLIAPLAHVS